MNVVVPFTRRHPEVEAALADAHWVDVSGSDESYWELWSGLWGARRTVIVVEHDIVPGEGMLEEMWDCQHNWCAARYQFEEMGLITGLGCVKMSEALMGSVPDALEHVATAQPTDDHPPRHWCSLDSLLSGALGRAGYAVHPHGEVRHLSSSRSHTCH